MKLAETLANFRAKRSNYPSSLRLVVAPARIRYQQLKFSREAAQSDRQAATYCLIGKSTSPDFQDWPTGYQRISERSSSGSNLYTTFVDSEDPSGE